MKVVVLLITSFLIIATQTKILERKVYLDFQSIIDHVNKVQKNWVAGHNKYFDGMDLNTIKGLMGALETPEHLKLPVKDIEPL